MKNVEYDLETISLTARVDADVLAWLKSDGKGYQSRMNAILRQTMLNAK